MPWRKCSISRLASATGLPCSLVSSTASSSTFCRTDSAPLKSSRPRASGAVSRQAGKAASAAAAAASTSSGPPLGAGSPTSPAARGNNPTAGGAAGLPRHRAGKDGGQRGRRKAASTWRTRARLALDDQGQQLGLFAAHVLAEELDDGGAQLEHAGGFAHSVAGEQLALVGF